MSEIFDWGTDTHWADGTPKIHHCHGCEYEAASPQFEAHDCARQKRLAELGITEEDVAEGIRAERENLIYSTS